MSQKVGQPELLFSHYNSLVDKQLGTKMVGKLRDYCDLRYHDTYGQQKQWLHKKNIKNRPNVCVMKQDNGYDCGVHVCANAFCLTHQIPVNTFSTEEEIDKFRMHIAFSIRESRLHKMFSYYCKSFPDENRVDFPDL